MKEHDELIADEDIHVPKGFDAAPNETALIKNNSGVVEFRSLSELGATGPEGPSGTTLENILVASINLPIELASEIGTTQGDIILVHEQVTSGPNPFATYTWDTDAGSDTFYNPPFTIPSTGGTWVNTGSGFHQGRLSLDQVSASKFHGSFRHVHREARSYFLHGGTQSQLISRVGYNRSELTGTEVDFFESNDDIYKTKTLSANTTLTFVGFQQNDTRYLEIDSPANETLTFPSYVTLSGIYRTDGSTNYIQLEVIDEGTYATGTITVVNNSFDSGDALSVNGVNFLFGTDWQSGASVEESAWNLARAISDSNASGIKGKVKVAINGAVITVTDRQGGTTGNSVALSATDNATTNFTLSGSTLSGGADGTVLAMISHEGGSEDIAARISLSSGLISGCVLSINAGDNSKFDMTSGIGVHVDNTTTPGVPIITAVTINAIVAGTPLDIATETVTFICFDNTGSLILTNIESTPAQRRDRILVGAVSHADFTTIDSVFHNPNLPADAAAQTHDLMQALGFFSTSGNQIVGNTGTMTVNKGAGFGFDRSRNFDVDPKDPHNFPMPALATASMFQILQDATLLTVSSTIDPTQYDNAGVLTDVPNNNNATISYIYVFPGNQLVYLFGQEVFSTLSDAINAAGTESTVVPTDLANGGLLLARIISRKAATDITDASDSKIIASSAVSTGGGTITPLQQSYDAGSEPEIVVTATRGAFSISDNTTPIAGALLEVQSNSGTIKYLEVNADSLRTQTQAYSDLNVLTDSVSIATDCTNGNVHEITLGGNRTLSAPTGLKSGATYLWFLRQDITGSRTLAFNAVFKFPGGITPTLGGTAGDLQVLSGVSDGTNVYVNLSPEYSP